MGAVHEPIRSVVRRLPSLGEWSASLGHQCIPVVTPEEAADRVRPAVHDV